MLLGEGRAERGHDVADPGLVAGDGVGVALDDDGLALGDDMLLRPVEAVEVALLVEERGLGGVEVLGLAVAHHAAAEADAAAALVP